MQYKNIVPKALAFILFTSLASNAFAEEKVLCNVSSDVDSNTGRIVYEMDADGRRIEHLYVESYVDGKLDERVPVNFEEINGKGIILHKKDKYITVRLYGHNFDDERGGTLYLDTLYNAVKGERKEYQIDVSKNVKNEIEMRNNNSLFNQMFFKAKKAPIIGVVGIEKVIFSKK